MTRLAILGDIHANLPALNAIIDDITAYNVDHVIVAGDSINWGPFSNEVMETLLARQWALMRGNHEFYLLYQNTPFMPAQWRHYFSPRWLAETLSPHLQNVIATLPDTLRPVFRDAPPLRVVHGSPGDHWRGIYHRTPDDEISDMLAQVEEETVIIAHTHLQMDRRVGRWRILNPGSVGLPLDGVAGACYMILDGDASGWTPTFRRVPYDINPLFDRFDADDFLDTVGADGLLIMREFRTCRPQIAIFNQWHAENHAGEPRSRALIEDFFAQDITESRMFFDYLPENMTILA